MTAPYKEGDFERAIEAFLTDGARGDAQWFAGDPANFDPRLALDLVELDAFIAATQPDALASLATRFGGDEDRARATLHDTVAKMLDAHGTLRCLRRGVTVLGIQFQLAYFRPEHGLTPQLVERYAANRSPSSASSPTRRRTTTRST